jgi:hypothetical protein
MAKAEAARPKAEMRYAEAVCICNDDRHCGTAWIPLGPHKTTAPVYVLPPHQPQRYPPLRPGWH